MEGRAPASPCTLWRRRSSALQKSATAMNDKQVAELFIEQHVLQPSQADDVLNEVSLNGKTIAQAMVDSGFVDEQGFYQTIAAALGTEFLDLRGKEIPQQILKLIPSGMA